MSNVLGSGYTLEQVQAIPFLQSVALTAVQQGGQSAGRTAIVNAMANPVSFVNNNYMYSVANYAQAAEQGTIDSATQDTLKSQISSATQYLASHGVTQDQLQKDFNDGMNLASSRIQEQINNQKSNQSGFVRPITK